MKENVYIVYWKEIVSLLNEPVGYVCWNYYCSSFNQSDLDPVNFVVNDITSLVD